MPESFGIDNLGMSDDFEIPELRSNFYAFDFLHLQAVCPAVKRLSDLPFPSTSPRQKLLPVVAFAGFAAPPQLPPQLTQAVCPAQS